MGAVPQAQTASLDQSPVRRAGGEDFRAAKTIFLKTVFRKSQLARVEQ